MESVCKIHVFARAIVNIKVIFLQSVATFLGASLVIVPAVS